MEVIILAGGLGTRLKSVVRDMPKPMALIEQKPFLEYIMKYLERYNVNKIVMAVSYKYNLIKNYFGNEYNNIKIEYSIEEKQLGTGGAIKKATQLINGEHALVLNGDTFLQLNITEFIKYYNKYKPDILIASKTMRNFNRYGTINSHNNIVYSFKEKKYYKEGKINAGVYIINKNIFNGFTTNKFSFEKDIMEKKVLTKEINIMEFNTYGYFIDIGVPTDYYKAQKELTDLIKI